MVQQIINIGTAPNDNTGDSGRVAGAKINANFTEIYTAIAGGGFGGGGFSGNYNDLINKPTLGSSAALDYGTTANKIVKLDGNAKLPAIDGSQLTNIPTGLTDISADTTPDLGGNLNVGSFNVGAAVPADLVKLHAITASAAELNYAVGVSSSIQTQLNSMVTKATYDANTILAATTDNTPVALTVNQATLVGRLTGGNIASLGVNDIRTLLNVEDGSTADMTGNEISSAIQAMDESDISDLATVLLDSVSALPALATFQDWREGTSYSRLLTPAFWKSLFEPVAVTYASTTVIDYSDNTPVPDTDRVRTLQPYITLTGNLTLQFNGITGSLIGRTIPITLYNGGDAARTLTLTGTANGITTSLASGVINPGIGALTGNWLRVHVWFKSATEAIIVGFLRSA